MMKSAGLRFCRWETEMGQQQQPSKEQIRQYMEARQAQQCPPPSMPEIRRQLGWGLIAANEDREERDVSCTGREASTV
jgi:hypothetical protein